jgi:hypothetical protein
MIKEIKTLAAELESYLPELIRQKKNTRDGLVADIAETIDYVHFLAKEALAHNTMADFPVLAAGQLRFISRLRDHLSARSLDAAALYGAMLNRCEELLRLLQKVQPPKGGHRGVLKTIRDYFRFLETDYNLVIVGEAPTWTRYSSGKVYLRLAYDSKASSSCAFGPESECDTSFEIRDLLFFYKDPRYLTVIEDLDLESEEKLQAWFGFLSDVFREYGSDVLSNQVGIFEKLNKAQAERDAEIAAMNEATYGKGNRS